MDCPCCGAELRGSVRYCTACGVAVHGLSAASALWIQSRKHIVVVLVCMLTIALAGGRWLGLQLYQAMSCFISAHSEHAIVLNISAADWDTDNGASRVPIHITGKTVDGITVDEVDYVASDGSGISLIQGVYTLEAAGPPHRRRRHDLSNSVHERHAHPRRCLRHGRNDQSGRARRARLDTHLPPHRCRRYDQRRDLQRRIACHGIQRQRCAQCGSTMSGRNQSSCRRQHKRERLHKLR